MDDQEEKQLCDAQKIHNFCSGKQDHLVWVVPSNNNDHWLTLLTRRNNDNQLETFVADSLGYDRSNDQQTQHQIKNIIEMLADEQGKLAKHQKISISQSSAAVAGTFDPNSPPDSEEDEEEDEENIDRYKIDKKGSYYDNMKRHFQSQSKEELQKSRLSHKQLINEHVNKLRAYKNNPEASDNKGFLKNAPSIQIREKIIQGRIAELERQIFRQKTALIAIQDLLLSK